MLSRRLHNRLTGGVMAHDSVLTSPHRRSQGFSGLSPNFKKAFVQNDLSCSALLQRHRFLLTALVLLVILCSIYLYFAVTLGDTKSCLGLIGNERELCHLKHAKDSLSGGGKLDLPSKCAAHLFAEVKDTNGIT
ncbi:hypothetical protein V2J09_005328 [Rumex salicifolius]